MARTGKDTTIFSHCLPANKGKKVTEEVFESEASKGVLMRQRPPAYDQSNYGGYTG